MRQRRKPPTEDLNWALGQALETTTEHLRQFVASFESIRRDEPPTLTLDLPGAVGWMPLPPTLEEDELDLIPLAWLSQGREVPEA